MVPSTSTTKRSSRRFDSEATSNIPRSRHHHTHDNEYHIRKKIQNQREKIAAVFLEFDDSEQGLIEKEEFALALKLLGFSVKEAPLSTVMSACETGDQQIDYVRFLNSMCGTDNQQRPPQQQSSSASSSPSGKEVRASEFTIVSTWRRQIASRIIADPVVFYDICLSYDAQDLGTVTAFEMVLGINDLDVGLSDKQINSVLVSMGITSDAQAVDYSAFIRDISDKTGVSPNSTEGSKSNRDIVIDEADDKHIAASALSQGNHSSPSVSLWRTRTDPFLSESNATTGINEELNALKLELEHSQKLHREERERVSMEIEMLNEQLGITRSAASEIEDLRSKLAASERRVQQHISERNELLERMNFVEHELVVSTDYRKTTALDRLGDIVRRWRFGVLARSFSRWAALVEIRHAEEKAQQSPAKTTAGRLKYLLRRWMKQRLYLAFSVWKTEFIFSRAERRINHKPDADRVSTLLKSLSIATEQTMFCVARDVVLHIRKNLLMRCFERWRQQSTSHNPKLATAQQQLGEARDIVREFVEGNALTADAVAVSMLTDNMALLSDAERSLNELKLARAEVAKHFVALRSFKLKENQNLSRLQIATLRKILSDWTGSILGRALLRWRAFIDFSIIERENENALLEIQCLSSTRSRKQLFSERLKQVIIRWVQQQLWAGFTSWRVFVSTRKGERSLNHQISLSQSDMLEKVNAANEAAAIVLASMNVIRHKVLVKEVERVLSSMFLQSLSSCFHYWFTTTMQSRSEKQVNEVKMQMSILERSKEELQIRAANVNHIEEDRDTLLCHLSELEEKFISEKEKYADNICLLEEAVASERKRCDEFRKEAEKNAERVHDVALELRSIHANDYSVMQKEYDAMIMELTKLETERESWLDLEARYADLEIERSELLQDVASIEEELARVIREKERLERRYKDDLEALRRDNTVSSTVEAENAQLREDLRYVKIINEDLEQQLALERENGLRIRSDFDLALKDHGTQSQWEVDREYMEKKVQQLRDQLANNKKDKDRLWEQARDDKAILAKALKDLQSQMVSIKTEKAALLENSRSDKEFLSKEVEELRSEVLKLRSERSERRSGYDDGSTISLASISTSLCKYFTEDMFEEDVGRLYACIDDSGHCDRESVVIVATKLAAEIKRKVALSLSRARAAVLSNSDSNSTAKREQNKDNIKEVSELRGEVTRLKTALDHERLLRETIEKNLVDQENQLSASSMSQHREGINRLDAQLSLQKELDTCRIALEEALARAEKGEEQISDAVSAKNRAIAQEESALLRLASLEQHIETLEHRFATTEEELARQRRLSIGTSGVGADLIPRELFEKELAKERERERERSQRDGEKIRALRKELDELSGSSGAPDRITLRKLREEKAQLQVRLDAFEKDGQGETIRSLKEELKNLKSENRRLEMSSNRGGDESWSHGKGSEESRKQKDVLTKYLVEVERRLEVLTKENEQLKRGLQ